MIIGTCGIIAMDLLYRLSDIVKCVCYIGLGSSGCFLTDATLMSGHYRMDIISGASHLRSDSVVSLVL
jgi:hypothetical protein